MKQKYLSLLFIVFSLIGSYAQVNGDFRSKSSGDWESVSSWETWSGGTWVPASTYPGQAAGTYKTTILSLNTITISSNLSTLSMGDLIVNGSLNLDPPSAPNTINLVTNTLNIDGGILNFNSNKIRINLPSTAVITIENGGNFTGSCTNNDEIYIGTKKYAACVGGGSTVYTFGEVAASGGNINAEITNPATGPVNATACTLINLAGGYTGTEINVTYKWILRDPNGIVTVITTGTLANDTQTTFTTFTPSITGQYLISLEITTTASATNVETRVFNVTDTTKPTITAPPATSGTTNVACTSTNVTLGTPAVADNCTATAGLIVTNDAPSSFPIGTTTVSWRVEDAAGNFETATQTVTVTDTTKPTITAPPATTGTTNVACTSTNVTLGTPVVADNCTATASLIVTNNAPSSFPIGTTTVSWRVEDAAGNFETATQTVTVTDTTKPTITAPPAINTTTNTVCTATGVVLGTPVVADNCTATAGLIVTNNAPSSFPIGTTTVSWRVEDAAGNFETATQTVTVTDTTKPTITAPPATTGTTNVACTSTNVTLGTPVVADNCTATAGLIVTNNAPSSFPIGITTVSWRVEDAAGNFETATQTVTVTDTTKPTITAPPATTGTTNVACTSTNVTLGTPAVADNCTATAGLIVTNNAPSSFPIGTTTVSWKVEDAAGNFETATQTVTVTDTTKPTITAPPATTGTTNVACTSTNVTLGTPVVADNCTATASLIVTNNAPSSFPIGTTTVSWRVEDAAGNFETATQTVTVTDTTKPTITAPAATTGTTNVACTSTNVTLGTPVVADNCTATAGLIVTNNAPSSFPIGITTVSWRVEDAAGNFETATQTVTVTDTTKPTITAPPATTGTTNVACTSTNVTLGTPAVADNCTATAGLIVTNNAPSSFPIGTTTVSWKVEDAAGNFETATQTVTVTDTTKPTITAPPATTGTTNVACTSTNVTLGTPVVADNCTATASLIVTNNAPSSFPIGTTTVSWRVEDAAGNFETATQTVTVTDTTKPTITAPPAINTTTNTACTATGVVLGTPVVADNCTATAGLIVTNNAPSSFPIGTTTVSWRVEDAAGNFETATQTVTVTDTTKPTITAPAATTGTTNVACTSTNVTLGTPVVADNCTATAGLIVTNNAPSSFPIGTTTVSWRVEDAAGNFETATQTVTVTDTTKPTITAPPAINTTTNTACTATGVVLGTPAVADNCTATAGLIVTNNAPSSFPIGTTTVSWRVEDAAGNFETATQTVTVTDTTKPTITAPAATSGTTNVACTSTNVTLGTPVVADNCTATAGLIVTNNAPSSFPIGTTTVSWRVEDAAGNFETATQTVTVTDTTKPTITAPPAINTTTNTACTATGVVLGTPAVADNCTATAGLIVTNNAPSSFPIGITTVSWRVEDAAGNFETATQTVTVTDTTKPTITAPPATTGTTNVACTSTNVTLGTPVVADNCTATAGLIVTNNAPSSFPIGTTTVSWKVEDAAGNFETATQTVTVTDTTKPTITAPPAINTTTNTACTATGVVLGTPVTADNCAVTTVTNNHPSTTYPLGSTTVIWTVTDASGNTATANQIVTVTDNIPPTITCPGNISANTSANGTGDCYTTVSISAPATNDNCGIASVIARVSGTVIDTATYQFPIGNTTVNWTVTDNAGLTAFCNQTITVVDNENPSISCPADQNVNYNTNCAFPLQDYSSLATASDNCDTNLTITQSPAPGTLITAATTVVTLTARDDANRISSCTFKVSATDNIAPTAVCKNYTAILSSNGTVTISGLNLDNGSSDNCGIANITVTPNSFNCSNVGDNPVIFTVYDNGGNSASCNAIVTVADNTAPIVICKNYVVVVNAITRVATIKVSDVDNGSNDACGIASLTVFPTTFADSPNVYTATTTLTAVDNNGNSNSCTATITVEPPKNQFTYLTGVIVNPVPDNPQPPSALVEVTACPGGITVPKDIQFTLQAIGTYNLQASDVINWEYSNDNGENWIVIPNTTGLLTYKLVGLTSDTFVRLRIYDNTSGTPQIKTSAEAYARFLPPDEPPIIVSHTALDICLGDSVTINAESFYDQPEGQFGKGGKFNYAQPDGWRVDGLDGFFPASGNTNSQPTWKETNSNSNPNTTFSGINYDTSDNTKFAIAHAAQANRTTTLETPVFSTIGMTSSEAILTFYTAYYFCNGGSGKIELSFDAGNTYTVTLNTMQNDVLTAGNTTGVHAYKGSNCTKQYPVADAFRYTSINLGPYAGLAGLRVKFTFNSGPSGGSCNNVIFPKHASNNCTTNQTFNVGSGWAIDDVGFTFGTVDDELEWTDEDGTVIAKGTTATVTPVTPGIREYGVTTLVNGCRTDNNAGTNYVTINTSLAYAGEDYTPLASNCGENTIQLNAYDNTKSAVTNYTKGSWKTNLYVVPDTASGDTDYPGTGITGTWSIMSASSSSCGNSAVFSSASDPDAIFTADPGSYTLRWTLSNGCFDEINITIIDCKSVDFDGNNDYVSFKDNYNLNSNFSIETWIKPNSINGTRTVFSRKDAGDNTKGYDLSIVNGQVQFNWYTGSGSNTITTGSYLVAADRWYHVAVTFDGSIYKLYVDGLETGTKNGAAPVQTSANVEALLGAMDQLSTKIPVNNFHGWVDEVKIWNKALTVEQIRQMMNQEIDALGTDVGGVVIPLRISGSDNDNNGVEDSPLLWADLSGYYRMTTNCGNLNAFKGVSGRLHNINTSEQQTAPIPYTSRVSNQTWDTDNTWTNFDVWNPPNSLGINNQPINWNIVKINHKITANTQDLTLLGLIVLSNELIITNSGTQDENNPGHGLWITHYLKLDGKIDLVGESQLLQKRYTASQFSESIFEENSTGYIERDQQGKKNSFNYNYWSSPVSNRGAANNSSYSVTTILRDGTDSLNPKTITFGDGAYFADGPLSSPIKISNRWIWTYSSLTPGSNTHWQNYYQWQYKSSNGLIAVGDGFTMKGTGGSAPISAYQNYVFTGKPNSGIINKFIALEQTYLIGNPYPSALDADEFIKDNLKDCNGCRGTINTFSGALYLWDHFGLSNNHLLAEYEGGYAVYTLTGGVAAIANDPLNVNNGATGSKIPQRYIAVGQSFLIDAGSNGTVQGGVFTFKNSQRAFVRETSGNSLFMKGTNDKNSFAAKETLDKRMKIRLGFDSAIGNHRQILVGTDPNTTNKFDLGYDAKMIEIKGNDIYWELENLPLIIQGIPTLDTEQIIPFGVKITDEGESTIKIDALENIPNSLAIYIYDKVTKSYYDLRKDNFKISLTAGEYNNRFSLQFVNKTNSINEININNGIICYYTNENKMLNIKNYLYDTNIESISLFNINRQKIGSWKITTEEQSFLQIPINTVSTAVYIVLIETNKGEFSQKIIIK